MAVMPGRGNRESATERCRDDVCEGAALRLGGEPCEAQERSGLVGDGGHHGASVASRWPIHAAYEADDPADLASRLGDPAAHQVMAYVQGPLTTEMPCAR